MSAGSPPTSKIRVGVNTAHCTVGVFGSEVHAGVHGGGVRGQRRRPSARPPAEPGSILCGFRTYALVKDRVKAEERGELTVKGARRPVEAWEIVGLADD